MRKLISITILLFYFVMLQSTNLFADSCLPDSRRVDWTKAGLLPDTDHSVDHWIYIDEYSGTDYEKINSALSDANNQSGNSIIYFQSPEYHINQKIDISFNEKTKDGNVVFLGNLSPDTLTTLTFEGVDEDENCFYISGYWLDNTASILVDMNKGDKRIIFDDHANIRLQPGEWVKFCEPNFDDNYNKSDAEFIGQLTQVESYSPGEITIKDEAAKNYSAANGMWLREFRPMQNIGFENMKIQRDNTSKGYGSTFYFSLAANCWLDGVELYNCTGYHIQVNRSAHLSFTGCFIHKATNYNSNEGTG